MQLVSPGPNYSTQVEAVIEKRPGLSFGAFVSFFIAHEGLDLLRKQAADRGLPPGGKNPRLL
jgi:hypothetical protein